MIFFQDLQLEYIHGYRGFDARDNLHYVNDGADIVFHAAGAGIVKNLPTGINPFLTNGFSHYYPLGETSYTLRGIRSGFISYRFFMKIL